jgi:hypothetical protein
MFFSRLKSRMKKEKPIGRDYIIKAVYNALHKIPKMYYNMLFKNTFNKIEKYVEKTNRSTRERQLKKYKKSVF